MKSALSTRRRISIAIGIGVLGAFLFPHQWRLPVRSIAVWDMAVVTFLSLTVLMMSRSDHHKIRSLAERDTERRWQILLVALTGSIFSLLAVIYMLKDGKNLSPEILSLHVTMAVLTVVCSWLLVHTMFALYYAHSYYIRTIQHPDRPPSLDFPTELEPDYWDFLYFSFIIGMTSQVADVAINTRQFRRLCTLHGILAFFYNTAIVAMSINLIAGLFGSG